MVFGPEHYTVIVSEFDGRTEIERERLPVFEPLKRGEEWYYYYANRTRRRGVAKDAIPLRQSPLRSQTRSRHGKIRAWRLCRLFRMILKKAEMSVKRIAEVFRGIVSLRKLTFGIITDWYRDGTVSIAQASLENPLVLRRELCR